MLSCHPNSSQPLHPQVSIPFLAKFRRRRRHSAATSSEANGHLLHLTLDCESVEYDETNARPEMEVLVAAFRMLKTWGCNASCRRLSYLAHHSVGVLFRRYLSCRQLTHRSRLRGVEYTARSFLGQACSGFCAVSTWRRRPKNAHACSACSACGSQEAVDIHRISPHGVKSAAYSVRG